MSPSEREIWLQYFSTVFQIHQLQEFLKNLRQPKNSQIDSLQAYDDIFVGCKKNILLVTHQIIQSIATSILRKNFKFMRKLEETEFRLKQLSQRSNYAKKQMDAINSLLAIDNRHTY